VEIAVVDGSRGLGNGRCLPAGPLREPPERLDQVDLVVVNGDPAAWPGAVAMSLEPVAFVSLISGESLASGEFARRFPDVHAVAGIGNPERFARTLEAAGVHAEIYAYPDHHTFTGSELEFDDDRPVVVTEKDAVKLRRLDVPAGCWYLQVAVQLDPAGQDRIAAVLDKHGIVRP